MIPGLRGSGARSRLMASITFLAAPSLAAQDEPPARPPPLFVRGDADGDARYGLGDAVRILDHLFLGGLPMDCLSAADAGDNGAVEIGDSILILFYLFSGSVLWFPPPFLACGTDPTADDLTCESYPPCGTPLRKTSSTGLDLIYVPPGSFFMGSPPDERGRSDDELLHPVTLTCGYYLGKFEVRREDYGRIMGSFPLLPPEFEAVTGGPDLPNTPVFDVTWNDAVEYCRRLSLLEGVQYRLPTEAEWEYACRAGTQTRFSFGDALDCIDGNCGSQPPGCPFWDYFWYSCQVVKKPVDGKLPNPWSFFGMHGNVGEWCLDWYGPYPTRPVVNPTGPPVGTHKVWRASESIRGMTIRRSAARMRSERTAKGQNRGFRVLQEVPCWNPGLSSP